jgi:signal transduction histidine kinase
LRCINMILLKCQFWLLSLSIFYLPDSFLQKTNVQTIKDIDVYEKLISKFRYSNPDSATFYAKKGLEFSKETKNVLGEARMLHQLGLIDDNNGYSEESREKYLRSLAIYKSLNNYRGIVKLNIRLGVVENRKGNYPTAMAYFYKALKVSEANKDDAGKLESYITMGEVYANQKKYATALGYYLKANALNDKVPFNNITLNLYNDLGSCYREIGDYKQATFYYKKGISLSQITQYMGLHITMLTGLAVVHLDQGNRFEAIKLQNEALGYSRKIHNFIREISVLTGLSDSYRTSNPEVAMSYLKEALALAKGKNANKIVLDVLNGIAELQNKNKDYKKAYVTKYEQYKIADSFYFRSISEKISNLQSQYELSKSKSDLQRLKFLNSQQRLERKILFWVVVCSFLIICILGLYYIKIRNLNRLLNKANGDLMEINTVKDKVFSVLGHDLRAPLASITNVLYLINKGMLDDNEQRIMLDKLETYCNASMETLDMLLKWGQMQLKGVKLTKVIFSPLETVQRNIRLLSGAAEDKSISIINEIPPEILVEIDADHFDFIIRNLLSNAIKFTPEGGRVVISTSIVPGQSDVQFQVKDNGIGIEDSKKEGVFEINNVSTVGTNNEKGTSLGLVICKEFVEANGGNIWVESAPGIGSTFFFTVVLKSNVNVPGAYELDIP